MGDRIAVDYRDTTVYYETPLNAVGATTSLTLRSDLAVPGANDAYVKRFGTPYPAIDVTAWVKTVYRGAANRIGVFTIYALDGTLLYTLTDTGAGAQVDGAAVVANTDCYIVLTCTDDTGGSYVVNNGDLMTLTTDVDAGGLSVVLSGETLAVGESVTWYLSASGSTYYDAGYIYGGDRHTPALNDAKYPYLTVLAGFNAARVAGGSVVEIMDSETYDENDDFFINASFTIQAALGHTPTLVRAIGARTTRESSAQYNNSNAVYVNPNGDDVGGTGTWQNPFATIAIGWAAAVIAGNPLVIGGTGATAQMTFNEAVVMGAAGTIEADVGYAPEIRYLVSGTTISMTANATYLRGCFIRGTLNGVLNSVGIGGCYDCTFSGATYGLRADAGPIAIERSIVYSCGIGIFAFGTGTLTFRQLDIHDCGGGITITPVVAAGSVLDDLLIYRCRSAAGRGIFFTDDINVAATIENLTIHDCKTGLDMNWNGAYAGTIDETIVDGCTNGVDMSGAATALTINFCNIDNNTTDVIGAGAGNLVQANAILLDPRLYDPANDRFALRPDSPCYHADGGGGNVGCRRHVIEYAANTIRIDGLIVSGLDTGFEGTYAEATRTDCEIEWCTFERLTGTCVDIYGAAATTWLVERSYCKDSGGGVALAHQDNTVAECAFDDLSFMGIYAKQTGQSFVHLSMFGADYGIFLTAAASAGLVDSIFSGQNEYAIYSDVYIYPTYCCVDGTVNELVVITDSTIIESNPFFIDTESSDKDLHLWSIESGYPAPSPCIDAASDGYDMGCYLMDRGITDRTRDTYILPGVTVTVNEPIVSKGEIDFENVPGSHSLAAKTHKHRVDLMWPANTQAPTEEFRHVIELLNTMVEDDHQGWTEDQIVMRLHLKPVSLIHGVFDGTIDASARTIQDATAAWVRNAYRGYDATARHYHSQIGVVDAVAMTVVVAAAGWTVDQWAGYWFKQEVTEACVDETGAPTTRTLGYRWYYILSNTADTLTYSDPYNRSETVAANFEFWIVSWHKIASNDDQFFNLEAEGAEFLTDGIFEVYVDLMQTRLQRSGVDVRSQRNWISNKPLERVPASLRLEEI